MSRSAGPLRAGVPVAAMFWPRRDRRRASAVLDGQRFDVVNRRTERGFERVRVAVRLGEEVAALRGGEQRIGEGVGVGAGSEVAALLHRQQAATQQGFPPLEAGG